ncbi:MAG: hypothetical protein DRJ39_04850 [Thermoprotei archaeon]|nr:MAG: hypothetical protein DRJ39_04850 [Thermoprotei archaeon]
MTTRHVFFSFKNSSEAVNFVSYIQSKMRGKNINISVKGKKVKITLRASKQDLSLLMAMIKNEYKNWKLSTHGTRTGFYKHSIPRILHDAKLKTSIPINSIIDVLTLLGYPARIESGYIVTTMNFENVIKITEKISEKYRELLENAKYAPMARRLLAVVLSTFNWNDINQTTEKLINMDILSIDSRTSKITLSVAYEKALEKIKEMVKTHGNTRD